MNLKLNKLEIRKTIVNILDYLGIHGVVNKIRFFIPTLIKRKRLHRHGLQALNLMNEVFDKNGSFFWLEFGTLLGAVRDKSFISHDYDIDLGVLSEKRIPNLSQMLEPLCFVKTREIFIPDKGVIEETFVYNGVHIDICYFYEEDENIVCYMYIAGDGEYWRDVIHTVGLHALSFTFRNNGFERLPFYDYLFYFPKDADLHLRECYGNYNVRIRNWSEEKCPNRRLTNMRVFHSKLDLF